MGEIWVPTTPLSLDFTLHLARSGSARQPQHSPTEGRRHLINVSGKLRLYCYSKKMAPFISAPSAQAHLLLLRQPTRTQQVCKSPALGVFSSQGCHRTWYANFSPGSLWSSWSKPGDWTNWLVFTTHWSIRLRPQGGDQEPVQVKRNRKHCHCSSTHSIWSVGNLGYLHNCSHLLFFPHTLIQISYSQGGPPSLKIATTTFLW